MPGQQRRDNHCSSLQQQHSLYGCYAVTYEPLSPAWLATAAAFLCCGSSSTGSTVCLLFRLLLLLLLLRLLLSLYSTLLKCAGINLGLTVLTFHAATVVSKVCQDSLV